jgi:hypothetical protein
MARALTAVGAALALALLVLGLVVYLNRDEDAIAVDNLLAESITREIGTVEQRDEDTVVLADVTDFAWDEVLIAAPDSTRQDISDELGAEWQGELEFRTGELLVFLRDGHAVRFADYRGEGRFEGIDEPVARFAREDAVFSVRDLVIRPQRPPPTSSP